MGFLLKIALFAVAGYVVWTSARRMLGIGGSRRPIVPPSPPSAPPRPLVEETKQCPDCGAFVAGGAAKCGRPNCPQPG